MKLQVVFRRVAKAELDEAIDWYETRELGLGKRFARAITSEVERISDAPDRFPHSHLDLRRIVVREFPYTIHYLVESEQVVIVAVFHAKRDPRRLRYRR